MFVDFRSSKPIERVPNNQFFFKRKTIRRATEMFVNGCVILFVWLCCSLFYTYYNLMISIVIDFVSVSFPSVSSRWWYRSLVVVATAAAAIPVSVCCRHQDRPRSTSEIRVRIPGVRMGWWVDGRKGVAAGRESVGSARIRVAPDTRVRRVVVAVVVSASSGGRSVASALRRRRPVGPDLL